MKRRIAITLLSIVCALSLTGMTLITAAPANASAPSVPESSYLVIPAKAGIQLGSAFWTPAFAGVTGFRPKNEIPIQSSWSLPKITPPPPTESPPATPTPAPTPNTTVTQNIFHIISFPFKTMMEAVVKMSSEILQAFYKEAQKIYGQALEQVLYNDYGIAPNNLGGSATPLFANIIHPHWNIAFSLALILLPATLALTAVSALRMSVISALGYADLKEALLGWVIAAGAAAASFYLLGLAHRLSLAAARAILTSDFGERVSGFALASAFFNAPALTQIALLFPPAALYVSFFVVFLATTIILALGLAIAAYTALAYLLSVIAPIVITLGVLPPLRWLHALWLKTITIAFLLPVIDAFLLKAALSLYRGFFDPAHGGSLFGFIASLFILGGVLSVLITINFKVGELVFGALAEVHRQAWDATTGVMQLALSAAALLAGGVIGGAALGGAGGGAAGLATSAPSSPPPTAGSATAMSGTKSSTSAASAGAATSGKISASQLASGATLGKRIEELAKSMSGGGVSAQDQEGGQTNSPQDEMHSVDSAESGKGTIPSDQTHEETASGANSGSRSSSPISGSAAQSGSHPESQLRQARLAEGFGRILTHSTRNPLLRSLGAGLQAGGLLSQYQASNTQHAQPEIDKQREMLLGSARRWATNPELNQEPYNLFDLGRDNSDLMLGGMFRSFMQTERAVDLGDLLPVVQGSYGQWLAQGRPGGLDAQREFFDLGMQESNKASPDHLIGALSEWADRHAVRADPGLAAHVHQAFASSVEIKGDQATDVESRIQKLLRTFK